MSFSTCPIATVHAPVEQVWRLLADPSRYDLWWNVRTVSIIPEGPAQPGQQIFAFPTPLARMIFTESCMRGSLVRQDRNDSVTMILSPRPHRALRGRKSPNHRVQATPVSALGEFVATRPGAPDPGRWTADGAVGDAKKLLPNGNTFLNS
jgi:hypothetical protein